MAECSITDSWILFAETPSTVQNHVIFFVWIMTLLCRVCVLFFLLLEFLTVFLSFLLYLPLLYLLFHTLPIVHTTCSVKPLPVFCFCFLSSQDPLCFWSRLLPLHVCSLEIIWVSFYSFPGLGSPKKRYLEIKLKISSFFILTLRADFWFKILFLKNLEDFRAFCLADEKFDSRSLADFLLLLFSH